MASVVDICNKALSLLGQTTISSLNDNSPEAYACRIHWVPLRDKVLRSHPWNCATKSIALARLVERPSVDHDYYYQLPADCLMVQSVYPEQYYDVQGKRILASSATLSIKYTHANDDTTSYDPQLASGLSYLLAAELCYQMTSSTSLMGGLRDMGEKEIADAKGSDSLEGRKPERTHRNWLRAKYGYGV